MPNREEGAKRATSMSETAFEEIASVLYRATINLKELEECSVVIANNAGYPAAVTTLASHATELAGQTAEDIVGLRAACASFAAILLARGGGGAQADDES
ncbi:MAG: hypothetical protein GEU76_01160 [Alphaproteobacteria bacterium]|nr:hypothetical protein [Alphaproteobacteria bacterium]